MSSLAEDDSQGIHDDSQQSAQITQGRQLLVQVKPQGVCPSVFPLKYFSPQRPPTQDRSSIFSEVLKLSITASSATKQGVGNPVPSSFSRLETGSSSKWRNSDPGGTVSTSVYEQTGEGCLSHLSETEKHDIDLEEIFEPKIVPVSGALNSSLKTERGGCSADILMKEPAVSTENVESALLDPLLITERSVSVAVDVGSGSSQRPLFSSRRVTTESALASRDVDSKVLKPPFSSAWPDMNHNAFGDQMDSSVLSQDHPVHVPYQSHPRSYGAAPSEFKHQQSNSFSDVDSRFSYSEGAGTIDSYHIMSPYTSPRVSLENEVFGGSPRYPSSRMTENTDSEYGSMSSEYLSQERRRENSGNSQTSMGTSQRKLDYDLQQEISASANTFPTEIQEMSFPAYYKSSGRFQSSDHDVKTSSGADVHRNVKYFTSEKPLQTDITGQRLSSQSADMHSVGHMCACHMCHHPTQGGSWGQHRIHDRHFLRRDYPDSFCEGCHANQGRKQVAGSKLPSTELHNQQLPDVNRLLFWLLSVEFTRNRKLLEECIKQRLKLEQLENTVQSQDKTRATLSSVVFWMSRKVKKEIDNSTKLKAEIHKLKSLYTSWRRQQRVLYLVLALILSLYILDRLNIPRRLTFQTAKAANSFHRYKKFLTEKWRNLPTHLTNFWRIFIFGSRNLQD